MYWQEFAAKTKDLPPSDHPFAELIEATLIGSMPDLHQQLFHDGELESFLRLKTADMIAEIDRLRKMGVSHEMAEELAMDAIFPREPEEPAEDWEIEGGMEDQTSALYDFLGGDG
jgi:hypothetical protein